MLTLLETLLWLAAIILLIPCVVLLIECTAAVLPRVRRRPQSPPPDARSTRVAVLVPAHNEASGIAATIQSIMPQLQPDDRLLVIADNCTDATADAAQAAGAEVAERHDPEHRGKGYALAHGLDQLADHQNGPPDVVIIVDADMILSPGSVDALAHQVETTGRAAQSVNLLDTPPDPGPRDLVASLAFAVKNLVRPRGLFRLGLPCHLMGTGMALPWSAVGRVDLASGNIVEDMQLGLDLAITGHAASLCETARVTGRFPSHESAARTQHARWEQGHLQTLCTQVPRLIIGGLRSGRPESLVLALDLCVPPLSLLVMTLLGTVAAGVIAVLVGIASPLAMLVTAAGIVFTAVILGSCGAGRGRQTLAAILSVPLYLAWKLPLYLGLLFQPTRHWTRTEREA